MTTESPCKHPPQCRREDYDGNFICAWCEQVDALKRDNAALLAAIKDKAVIIHDGTVSVDGPIGYLALYGGTVKSNDRDSPRIDICTMPLE